VTTHSRFGFVLHIHHNNRLQLKSVVLMFRNFFYRFFTYLYSLLRQLATNSYFFSSCLSVYYYVFNLITFFQMIRKGDSRSGLRRKSSSTCSTSQKQKTAEKVSLVISTFKEYSYKLQNP
jgi:hypothetical protein